MVVLTGLKSSVHYYDEVCDVLFILATLLNNQKSSLSAENTYKNRLI